MNFLFGFLCCWVIIAILQMLADTFDWLYADWYFYLTAAPIIIPSIIIGMFIYQWRYVIRPISKDIFESELKRKTIKVFHISRFKICYYKKANYLWYRLYFVIVRKE